MVRGLCRKDRFLVLLIYVAVLGLLTVSGLGCGGIIRSETSSVSKSPTTEYEYKSYITPDCRSVKEALQDAVGRPPYELSRAGFDDIRSWVADNIDYESDDEQWRGDYWQTPEETLSYRTGDCEDFAILLCSLLRAYGIGAEEVYVAIGVDDEEHAHAFVIENWYEDGEWRRIESQASAQFSSHTWLGRVKSHPDSELDKYEITTVFNDVYYNNDDESFSWSEEQADFLTLGDIWTAVGDITRRLSQVLGYLLGLLFN
jgi:predicted transglutaminase-like cysteine proteinase